MWLTVFGQVSCSVTVLWHHIDNRQPSNKNACVLSLQGQWRWRHPRPGLCWSPQFTAHGPEKPLRLLLAPRGLLLSGPVGCAVHPAAAWEQEEAAAPDVGRWGAVQASPFEQEEEGQCATAGHAQPRNLIRVSQKEFACIHLLCPSKRKGSNIETWSDTLLRSLMYPPLLIPNAASRAELPLFFIIQCV